MRQNSYTEVCVQDWIPIFCLVIFLKSCSCEVPLCASCHGFIESKCPALHLFVALPDYEDNGDSLRPHAHSMQGLKD